MERNIVIAGYKRTPFHFAHKGALARVRPDDLGAAAVKALLDETGVDPKDIEDLIMGCAFPEGEQGYNVARLVVNLADLPLSVAGMTINRFCGSSMQSIHSAAGAILAGAGEVFICAGLESMTRIPMGGFNPLPNPALMEKYPQAYISMGETAENLSKEFKISRKEQEEFAVNSHRKAAAAQADGRLDAEIVPLVTKDGETVDRDGCIRGNTTPEAIADLRPAFDKDGVVTAATSSPLTDGASAVLVTTEEYAKAHNLDIMAKIRSMAVAGCKSELMGYGPVPATQKALERAGLTIDDIDVFDLNEAFAVQAMTVIRELGIDEEKVNLDGGAIAIGHPLGASGARITGKAAQIMKREGKSLALSSMCIGGGQGITTILEAA
ncbi:MAG: thiolase family protein [Alphaproteobacteria bacterium]|nr:MAG: thiolase family protein [Alphaproteobacteria bacterium]